MKVDLILKIRNDTNLYRYMRENSYLYKYLNRDPNYINIVEQEMKNRYKLTTEDKLKKINEKLSFVKSIMDVMR